MPRGVRRNKFAADIRKFVDRAKDDADTAVRKIALGILANVVTSSPVDTGRFRANWQAGVGSPPQGTLPIQNKDPSAAVARAQPKISEAQIGDIVFLVNNLPYARRLEYGWSDQAPGGMVRIAIKNIPAMIKDLLK